MNLLFVVLILLGCYAYLFWSLKRGRISYKLHRHVGHKKVVVERATNPLVFWITWVGSFVAVTAMVFTFIAKNI